jgi:signal transduction histidine kinase
LTFAPDEVRLDVLDDGCGFDPSRLGKGYGLLGIKERVHAMGGQLAVRSSTCATRWKAGAARSTRFRSVRRG